MSENQTYMIKVRDKGEITLPIELREKMKLKTGSLIGIEVINGQVHFHKIIPHRMRSNDYQQKGENEGG